MKFCKDHWVDHAAQWQYLASPLKPCRQDIDFFEICLTDWAFETVKPDYRALFLGVTPEIATMKWPEGTAITAIDRCENMISKVWPGQQRPSGKAVCADWKFPPFVIPGTFDIIIGDGCFTTLAYPNDYFQIIDNLHNLLSPNGILIIRFFLKPDKPESLDDILSDLEKGRIISFHALKWRIAMALQGNETTRGVILDDIWKTWNSETSSKMVNNYFRWRPKVTATINNYQGVTSRYSFPDLQEIRHVFSPGFKEMIISFGDYELAERCPRIVFVPKS